MTHYLVGPVAYPASNTSAVKHGRPVVVIDPEDRAAAKRLMDAYVAEDIGFTVDAEIDALQCALRSLLAPEKPAEPQGLGAVVEDGRGTKWLRHDSTTVHQRWLNTDDCDVRYRTYDQIDAVKVLSEGVTA